MLMKLRAPRVKKTIEAFLDDGTGLIENISTTGGFLKTDHMIPKERFNMKLKVMGCKTIKMNCESQWDNGSGVGFKILDVENSKQEFFNQYIENQFQAFEMYGEKRVFTSEILVTLKDTNVFGNVYFSNFIEYQGVIREQFLLSVVPGLHEMLAKTQVRLVTVDVYNKFVSNAYFGDTLLLELTTSDINGARCKLNINFRNKATGKLVGKGYQQVCVVSAKGKVIRIPDVLLQPLDFYQEVKN
jgi:enediyne biosynthesis thioesterase